MCDICLHSPCLHGCPNETIATFGVCSVCGEGIPIGDEYADIDGDWICERCIDDMTKKELLEYLGYSIKENEAEGR